MNEQELLLDCIGRLNTQRVNYMLTGSMASNAWGIPRSTHDLDFVIQLPPSEVSAFVVAFAHPDYYLDEASVRAAYKPPFQFNLIHIPSALKADFWMLRPIPFERQMFNRRVQDTWFGQPIWLATAEDVILHKLYWNQITPSDRQLADVDGTASEGGPTGSGTLFAINTDGTGFTNLHNFSGITGGENPVGLILSGSALYGTTDPNGDVGGGMVFKLSLSASPPKLTITPAGENVILSWPTSATGFTLQSTTNLVSAAVWTNNLSAPVVVSGRNTVTNPISGAQRFYRLAQ